MDKKCPREVTKSVHENSPSENVHLNSLILKKKCPREFIVHEKSPSPKSAAKVYTVEKSIQQNIISSYYVHLQCIDYIQHKPLHRGNIDIKRVARTKNYIRDW